MNLEDFVNRIWNSLSDEEKMEEIAYFRAVLEGIPLVLELTRKYHKEARWDIVCRAMEVLHTGFNKRLEDMKVE